MSAEDDVRPYLVGNNVDVVLLVDLHRLFDLPALPNASRRVVGRAEKRGVDVVFDDLALHILEIHTPDAVLVAVKL